MIMETPPSPRKVWVRAEVVFELELEPQGRDIIGEDHGHVDRGATTGVEGEGRR